MVRGKAPTDSYNSPHEKAVVNDCLDEMRTRFARRMAFWDRVYRQGPTAPSQEHATPTTPPAEPLNPRLSASKDITP